MGKRLTSWESDSYLFVGSVPLWGGYRHDLLPRHYIPWAATGASTRRRLIVDRLRLMDHGTTISPLGMLDVPEQGSASAQGHEQESLSAVSPRLARSANSPSCAWSTPGKGRYRRGLQRCTVL